MNENISVTRFPNNLTVLSERMKDSRSATIGFFFRVGSRDEPSELSGICHFIEHCVFKGTTRRNALQIAIETDRLGGHFDAFTSREETAFSIKCVDRKLPRAFDLMADMLANPLFDETELKREQGVIIEEMKMVEDTPEDYLGELFCREFFPNHPLGLSIAGTPKTVRSFNRAKTLDFYKRNFHPSNLIVAAAGNVEHSEIVELTKKYFETDNKDQRPKTKDQNPACASPILLKQKRNLEQNHLILAVPFVDAKSDKRYAANLLANVLGGGASSRLWQKAREERGLAYSVGANAVAYADCGFLEIFAAVSPENFAETVELSVAELKRLKSEKVSAEELRLVKDQISDSILLGLDDSGARAGNLASCEIIHGRQISLEETLSGVEKVTPEEIQALAQEFFAREKLALAGLGNFKVLKIDRESFDL